MNLSDEEITNICWSVVNNYYNVDRKNGLSKLPLLHSAKTAFVKAHRVVTGSSLNAATDFANGPGRFAVHELQTRVEERKRQFGEGIYG